MKLKVGDPAPEFSALDQEGKLVTLGQLRGHVVVLYFYPRDSTPGCTKEACGFRDYWDKLQQLGVIILGVSTDSVTSHQKFRTKYDLPFSLLSDPEAQVAQAYEVWGEKKFMGKTHIGIHRVTFVIDAQGQIQHIFPKVKPEHHAQEVWQLLTQG